MDSSKTAGSGVILWPVEPFDSNPADLEPMCEVIDLWRRAKPGQAVLPVSVVGPADVRWPAEVMTPLVDYLGRIAHEVVTPALDRLQLEGGLRPRILVQPSNSRAESVAKVIELALSEGAELIAASTHGQKGRGRIRLGSFTESLIANSPVPVLALNPKTEVPKSLRKILLPTEFAPGSEVVFERAVLWAQRFSAKLTLLNRFVNPVPAVAYGPFSGTVDGELIAKLMQEADEQRQKQACEWVAIAAKSGVQCEVIFDRGSENLDEMIVRRALEVGADLIVMATYRGTLGRLFLGSVARDVLATAKCPVVVIHPPRTT